MVWKKNERPPSPAPTPELPTFGAPRPERPASAAPPPLAFARRPAEPGSGPNAEATERSEGIEPLVLGLSVSLQGDLHGEVDVVVSGTVQGRISCPGHEIRVSPEGRVRADLAARVIRVEGEVTGQLRATEQVVVHAGGAVQGDITAPRVAIEDGARFEGKIEMREPEGTAASD
jgi:cytoskeletal protein CcmA (bactofilin family)